MTAPPRIRWCPSTGYLAVCCYDDWTILTSRGGTVIGGDEDPDDDTLWRDLSATPEHRDEPGGGTAPIDAAAYRDIEDLALHCRTYQDGWPQVQARKVIAHLGRIQPTPTVLALPEEPGVGRRVQVLRDDVAALPRFWVHDPSPERGLGAWRETWGKARLTFLDLLTSAGPSGVRVLPEGGEGRG